jgi:hypothetical protein
VSLEQCLQFAVCWTLWLIELQSWPVVFGDSRRVFSLTQHLTISARNCCFTEATIDGSTMTTKVFLFLSFFYFVLNAFFFRENVKEQGGPLAWNSSLFITCTILSHLLLNGAIRMHQLGQIEGCKTLVAPHPLHSRGGGGALMWPCHISVPFVSCHGFMKYLCSWT